MQCYRSRDREGDRKRTRHWEIEPTHLQVGSHWHTSNRKPKQRINQWLLSNWIPLDLFTLSHSLCLCLCLSIWLLIFFFIPSGARRTTSSDFPHRAQNKSHNKSMASNMLVSKQLMPLKYEKNTVQSIDSHWLATIFFSSKGKTIEVWDFICLASIEYSTSFPKRTTKKRWNKGNCVQMIYSEVKRMSSR